MNEKRVGHKCYVTQTESNKIMSANALLGRIVDFMGHNKMSAADFLVLESMTKQLSQCKNGLPRKVLRGMQTKFTAIQSESQR